MLPRHSYLSALLSALSAATLAVGFVLLLGRYYAFYHLGGGGAAMGLLLVVLPLAALIACAVALLTRRRVLGRGASVMRASLSGVAAATVLLAVLFSLEVWRTTALRSGEGIGAGDLAPFMRSLVSR
jgi:hypothetical protein